MFGVALARQYRDGLKKRFLQIQDTPLLYPEVGHIRAGYRRSVFKSHSIYYRIDDEGVTIIRVLGREDPEMSLPD